MAEGSVRLVEWYRMPSGRVPLAEFLNGLHEQDRKRALSLLGLLERRERIGEPQSQKVETGLFELRKDRVRMFYIFLPGRRAMVLDGILKKQWEIPQDVLNRVRAYRRDAEAREKKAQ